MDEIKQTANLYVPDKWYSLTINPTDVLQYWNSKGKRCSNFVSAMCKKLKDLCLVAHFRLYPEFAPITGRLHYHGIIKFRSDMGVISWYNAYAHHFKDNFMYEIDTISDRKVWEDYCRKNEKVMKLYFKTYNQPYRLTGETVTNMDLQPAGKLDHIFGDQSDTSDGS